MTVKTLKEYGHNIRVEQRDNEYRVVDGRVAVKNFSSEDEADEHAQKLADRKDAGEN